MLGVCEGWKDTGWVGTWGKARNERDNSGLIANLLVLEVWSRLLLLRER